jgi:hypothetical protein
MQNTQDSGFYLRQEDLALDHDHSRFLGLVLFEMKSHLSVSLKTERMEVK